MRRRPVAPEHRPHLIRAAYANLQVARDMLVLAGGCRQTLPKVRKALTSCGGAIRHADGLALRAAEGRSQGRRVDR